MTSIYLIFLLSILPLLLKMMDDHIRQKKYRLFIQKFRVPYLIINDYAKKASKSMNELSEALERAYRLLETDNT